MTDDLTARPAVWLYGSVTRGDDNGDSDILVVLDSFETSDAIARQRPEGNSNLRTRPFTIATGVPSAGNVCDGIKVAGGDLNAQLGVLRSEPFERHRLKMMGAAIWVAQNRASH